SVDSIMFAISSPWQQEMLKRYGKMVCMDSTHNTKKPTGFLYTLIVKNQKTGRGVPVAFMMT
ncbi:hypothetical protein BT69DRAFT_1197245, partial [Atractiella rhizophila]